jgi:hypothetical protein
MSILEARALWVDVRYTGFGLLGTRYDQFSLELIVTGFGLLGVVG